MPDARLVLSRDLRDAGMTAGEIHRMVTGLQRLAPGTFADLTGLSPEAQHLVRVQTVLSRVTNVVASHVSAAVAWGLPTLPEHLRLVHVSRVPPRVARPTSLAGYRMHSPLLDPAEVVRHEGPARTTVARTVVDCTRLLGLDWGVVVTDCALRRGLVDVPTLVDAVRQMGRLKGSGRARRLPAEVSAHAESPGESLLRIRLRRFGHSLQEQVSMPWIEGRPRVDFLVDGCVVVEFDGRTKYGLGGDSESAHWAEKQRHDRLVEEGFEVLHVTWAQLGDETALRVRVERARARARHRRGAVVQGALSGP